MNDKEIRKKLSEIFNLVLDINSLEARSKTRTGCKPTVFMDFCGHVACIHIALRKNGWGSLEEPDKKWDTYIDSDTTLNELDKVISELKEFKEGAKDDTEL